MWAFARTEHAEGAEMYGFARTGHAEDTERSRAIGYGTKISTLRRSVIALTIDFLLSFVLPTSCFLL